MFHQVEQLSLGFGLDYAGRLIYCEVNVNPGYYGIRFNSKPVAEIQLNDFGNWMLTYGQIIPQTIIDEIGERIENKYS